MIIQSLAIPRTDFESQTGWTLKPEGACKGDRCVPLPSVDPSAHTVDIRILSETLNDESPTLAPNGSMVLYATQRQGKGILAVVSVDTSVKYFLPSATSDVREPAWGPFKF